MIYGKTFLVNIFQSVNDKFEEFGINTICWFIYFYTLENRI